jgi:hypothetical protein
MDKSEVATATTNAPVADQREALQHKLRMVVSHATGGSSQDIDASVNDICVEITRMRNMVWEGGRQSALRDAAKAQTTLPIHGEMREALDPSTIAELADIVRTLSNSDCECDSLHGHSCLRCRARNALQGDGL